MCDKELNPFTRIYQLEQAIERVRELHTPDYDNACQVCIKDLDYDEYLPVYEEYPCPTIEALEITSHVR
jgi:hypothetical protein